jgi:hypothetical protein
MDIDDITKWLDDPAKWVDGDASTWFEIDDNEDVAPLAGNELTKSADDLARWRTSVDFREVVHRLCKRARSSRFFNDPQYVFLRDAWVIAEFVHHQPVDQVRLANRSEQWPDGYVRIGGNIENVEVTIALTDGRKMGDEYKFSTRAELDPVEDWVKRADAIPFALEKTITGKTKKRYGSPMWLVVYLNINEYGIKQVETEAAIAAVKQRHATSFRGLFVLWKDKLL